MQLVYQYCLDQRYLNIRLRFQNTKTQRDGRGFSVSDGDPSIPEKQNAKRSDDEVFIFLGID